MLPLIPSWLLVLVIGFAFFVQMKQRRYEHAFTRLLYFGLYAVLMIFPNISLEDARFFSRYFLMLLFIIEIISFYFRKGGMK